MFEYLKLNTFITWDVNLKDFIEFLIFEIVFFDFVLKGGKNKHFLTILPHYISNIYKENEYIKYKQLVEFIKNLNENYSFEQRAKIVETLKSQIKFLKLRCQFIKQNI